MRLRRALIPLLQPVPFAGAVDGLVGGRAAAAVGLVHVRVAAVGPDQVCGVVVDVAGIGRNIGQLIN